MRETRLNIAQPAQQSAAALLLQLEDDAALSDDPLFSDAPLFSDELEALDPLLLADEPVEASGFSAVSDLALPDRA